MADRAPRMTAYPRIPYWHLPSDCAYSKLRGLKKTKMLFLLEPYLAAVLFSFSLTDKYMLTKAKQNKENRNRRTLHIYLEPSGFSTPRSSQVRAALGQLCWRNNPLSHPCCTHSQTQSLKAHFIPTFPPPNVVGAWGANGLSCLPQWGLFRPWALPTSPTHLLSEVEAEGTSSLVKKRHQYVSK